MDEDKVNRTELISKKGLSREELWHELRMMMDEVESPVLQSIIKQIYGDRSIRDRLRQFQQQKDYTMLITQGYLNRL